LASKGFDQDVLKAIGPFYTKGMSEETKAFTEGLFTVEEYIAQSDLVLDENLKALRFLLSDVKKGFLFFYISTLDLDSHVLWRFGTGKDSRLIERYRRMDDILSLVRSGLGPEDILYVISDHGFCSFEREVSLVTWLAEEGYLVYNSPVKRCLSKLYSDIDWQKTRAYPVGFNGLFINRKGREASGIVGAEDYGTLVEEIRQKLLTLRDGQRRVFHNVYRPGEIYSGPQVTQAPDLVLGYNAGFGPSDKSVLGTGLQDILSDHAEGFTGHHAVDASLVPGIFFCSRKLTDNSRECRLEDISVTILKDFGVPPGKKMTGTPLY
jgi:predicted AlkP superfamily phosphohydrolase/phosphomutase